MFICFVKRGGVSLMRKENTQFMAFSTFLEILPLLGKAEFKSPAQKIVADKAQLRLAEMNAVGILLMDLVSGQKQSGRKDGEGTPE